MKRKNNFFYVVIYLFLTQSISIFSQVTQNIKGSVIDKQSEFPLDAATIIAIADGKEYGAITNFDGEYFISNVPIGKVTVMAQYNGFNSQSFKQLNLNSGKELVVNFTLLEKLESLDEIVLTAKSKRESVAYVTASSASFNVEQTNKYAGSLNDVSRMAMNYAGVSSSDDSRNEIIVRGNNPSSLLWVIEGSSVPSPNHYSTNGASGGPVSMLNINTLSKSDFLSGAFSANFGNTTSAAFDLQFRKPNKDKTEFVGQIGFAGAELGVEGPFSKKGDASYLVNYRYSTLALFDALGFDLGLGTAIPNYQDINTVVNIPTKKAGEFKIWAIGGLSKIKFNTGEEVDENNIYISNENSVLIKKNKNLISGLTHNYFFNKKTSSKISLSFSHIDEIVKIDTLNRAINRLDRTFDMDIVSKYVTLDAKINSKINKKNKLSVGVNYNHYGTDLNMSDYVENWHNKVDRTTGLMATYVNWQHRFTSNLVLNTGMRYNYFTLNKQSAFEPRVGLKYKIKPKTSLTFAYGLHSNINPLLSYFTKQRIAPGQYEFENTDLSFLKSHHFIFGVNQKIKRVKVKAEVYYQSLFDVPISHENSWYSIINSGYGEEGGSQIFFDTLYNEGKGKNYGLDLTFEYPLKNGFYSLLTGSLYNSEYLANDNIWRNTAWNGNFMMSLLTGKEFRINEKSSIGADVNFNITGGRRTAPIDLTQSAIDGETVYYLDRIFEDKLENYIRTDLKISYKRNGKRINQEWQVDLRNVFNRRNLFSQTYNVDANEIQNNYQMGFLPVVQYRILF
ncbi:MAG: TonB-dependent receptor [Flavobacteriaceae bacterium]